MRELKQSANQEQPSHMATKLLLSKNLRSSLKILLESEMNTTVIALPVLVSVDGGEYPQYDSSKDSGSASPSSNFK